MNQTSSTDSSISATNRAPDAVSRRAYELWESEGRPEGCDLKHWLQAEQELGTGNSDNGFQPQKGGGSRPADSAAPRNTGSDTRPLQGTRAASAANREQKRGSASPFAGDKSGSSANGQNSAKRKSTNAPPL